MKCEKCGSDTRMQVQVTLSAPGSAYHQLTKKDFHRKEFQVLGANWETANFICTNPDCCHVSDGYGNYVTKLEKKNKELSAEVERLKAKYEGTNLS
ncbi:polysaccharide synthesis protein GtrA [Novimethylophilus kurashikiensis]|uniref:Polysaccharide synthesis protein GtrA n=1 Tax=Novimethylophilus kurashikiensis TaxID=1825523 RepID=A0A2R5FE72_9PROT|nr:hypothetical protein [Novimethylophilus kurashikiensis]GBG14851.1 polysaccharide synthesis protein GtrA [Novimethylophilus kurashikiensis]